MKRYNSKICLFLIICFLCIFKSSMVLAQGNNDIKQFDEKNITDVNKVWTVVFRGAVDMGSVYNNVYIKDISMGSDINVKVQKGHTDSSIEILPPYDGYIKGHSYELYINKNVKSIKNVNLENDVLMRFNVKNEGVYDADVNVLVGENPFTMFKKVTIKNVSLDKVKKFKVEDGDQIETIGETVVVMTSKDKLKTYFYDAENKVIGESIINVSENNSGKIQIDKK